MAPNNTPGAFGEVNRKYWDTQVERISQEPWIQNLARQILDHLRSNLSWLGIREASSSPQTVRLLDYACGPGLVSKALLPYCAEIRGIDVSEGMVDKFNAEAREAGMSESQMRAVRGDLLAPADGSLGDPEFYGFDLAVMSMALHHVDDPKAMVASLVERVKPGGTVVIIDWIPSDDFPPMDSSHDHHSLETPPNPHQHHNHTHGHQHHSASHTLSTSGFSQSQMREMILEAGCRSSDFVLAASPSEVPPGRTGQKQMFFAKGIR